MPRGGVSVADVAGLGIDLTEEIADRLAMLVNCVRLQRRGSVRSILNARKRYALKAEKPYPLFGPDTQS